MLGMSGFLKVSTNSMKIDAERIMDLNNKIPQLMDELNSAMKQLSTCWEGPAWSVYQSNVVYHMEMLNEIYHYMNGYLESIQEARENYGRVEQDVCANIAKINTLW